MTEAPFGCRWGACAIPGDRNRFPCASAIHLAKTRLNVALLGPCYKTGGARTQPSSVREESTWAWRDSSSQFHLYPPTTGLAPFPHGTCALSVSETYVSLGGKHHLIHSTIPTTATHCSRTNATTAARAVTGSASLHRLSTARAL